MDIEKQILPIGTICKLKNKSGNIMIIGFLKLEYSNTITKYDYFGCKYPEGMLLSNETTSFNDNDIESIIYEGYKDEKFNQFSEKLKNFSSSKEMKKYATTNKANVAFDENGIVVVDGDYEKYQSNKYIEKADDNVNDNPFKPRPIKEENSPIPEDSSKWSIFRHIEFDSNGTVIAAEENDPNTPNENMEDPTVIINKPVTVKFDDHGNVTDDMDIKENINETSNIRFDSNGTVIADDSAKSSFTFDENGVVVDDGNEEKNNIKKPESTLSSIKFDDNGFVINE